MKLPWFTKPKPADRDSLTRRGWHVAGTSTKDGFIVTVRRGPVSATFRAPSEEQAIAEAARYVEASP
jgi:hypothetical protein